MRPDLTGLHIVVEDDNVDARDILSAYFEHLGASVTPVADAGEALAKLKEVLAHVVISDISMPGMDGLEFIRQLRALAIGQERATYAIAFSGFTTNAHRAAAFEAGYDAFVAKPADPLHLASQIEGFFSDRGSTHTDKVTGLE